MLKKAVLFKCESNQMTTFFLFFCFCFLREEQSLFLINKDKNIISVSLGGNYLKGPVLFDLEFEKRPLPSPAAVIGNVAKLCMDSHRGSLSLPKATEDYGAYLTGF